MSKLERDIKKCAELMERKKKLESEIADFPFAIRAQARYGMLEPCPICGKMPEMADRFGSIVVVCIGCRVSFRVGWDLTTPEKVAIDGWNRNVAQLESQMGLYKE